MKKESGLKTTWQRFRNRASSLILAGAVAISILPMAVSAADEPGSTKFWQTIVDLNMDGFEALRAEGVTSDTATVDGRTYGVDFCWGTNARRNGNSHAYAKTAASWYNLVKEAYAAKPFPAEVSDYVLAHHGNWCDDKWSSSDSGWAFSNLWDASTVAVGDTVKVSAWVYPQAANMKKQVLNTSKNCYEPTGAQSDEGEMRLMAGGETAMVAITGDQWNELTMKFDINENNISSGKVQVDSGAPALDAVYATRWVVGSIKVEVLGESGGNYTIAGSDAPLGYHWETIENLNMDDFTMGTKGDWTYDATKTVDGRTVTVSPDGAGKKIHQGSDFYTPADIAANYKGTTYNMDSITENLPSVVGDKLFLLNRALNQNGNDWAYKWPSPSSAIRVKNIFDTSKITNGERVRISAWVYPARIFANYGGISANPGPSEASDQTQATKLRMWLTDSTLSPNAPNTKRPGEVYYDSIVTNQWNQVAITYTVDDYNKAVANVRIDSAIEDAEQKDPYPLYLALAGVKAEKLVANAEGSNQGTVSGTISAKIDDATDTKIVVAAYKGNELLGCDIVDADAATTKYSFSIADAYGTDKVIAYIWKLDNANPVLAPIPLTAN